MNLLISGYIIIGKWLSHSIFRQLINFNFAVNQSISIVNMKYLIFRLYPQNGQRLVDRMAFLNEVNLMFALLLLTQYPHSVIVVRPDQYLYQLSIPTSYTFLRSEAFGTKIDQK